MEGDKPPERRELAAALGASMPLLERLAAAPGARDRWLSVVRGVAALLPFQPRAVVLDEGPAASAAWIQKMLEGCGDGERSGTAGQDEGGVDERASREVVAAGLALAWWCWSGECGGAGWRWADSSIPGEAELTRGWLACAGDVARLQRDLEARVRPASHPHSRILSRLREGVESIPPLLAAVMQLLRASRGSQDPDRAASLMAAWLHLAWARSQVTAICERLVYLPAGDVHPVLYTVLEEVFPGAAGTPVTLTAVPSHMAMESLGLRSSSPGGVGREPELVTVPLEDLSRPLFWPLLGRGYALAAEGEEGLAADLSALSAFGPSYLLALSTRWASRWPAVAPSAWEDHFGALAGILRAEGLEDEPSRAWVGAMCAARAPFHVEQPSAGACPEGSGEAPAGSLAGSAGRVGTPAEGRPPVSASCRYRREQALAAAELVEGLTQGCLISSRRLGAKAAESSAPVEGAAGATAELYRLLRQVQDIPAASAEILHAGWMYFVGPLVEEAQREWVERRTAKSPSWDNWARRLSDLDALLMRSLDVAAVHRLYVREGISG